MKIKGFVGEYKNFANCNDCGCDLWNDNGYLMEDGTAVCVRQDKCFRRKISNSIAAEKAAGTWNPRWRQVS